MRRHTLFAALLLPLSQACYTRAQIDNLPPAPLVFRVLPYPTYDADEGLTGHVVAGWRSSPNRRPPPVALSIGMDARLSTSGSRGLLAMLDAPARWKSWRLLGVLGAERLQRVPFYGLGNSSQIADTTPDLYYRYSLLRTTALVNVQRRITRPIRLHLGAQWRHYRAQPLNDTTLYAELVALGQADSGSASNLELRVGLMFDTRDEEATPTRGIFLEAMAVRAVSGYDYTRYLLSAREFFPFGDLEQWVLALRQTAELSRDPLPIYVANERLTTWYPEDGFGGPTSLRLFAYGRFVAPNRAIASVDLRNKVWDAPIPSAPIRLWVLGFADVGRLWETGQNPSTRDLHWSSGVGGRLQLGKGVLFGLDLGMNDEGFGFGTAVSFAF